MTETKATHTPELWEASEIAPQRINANGLEIASLSCARREWRSNRDFILRAVNSHADLLKACKMVWSRQAAHVPLTFDELCELRALIARAEGGAQ